MEINKKYELLNSSLKAISQDVFNLLTLEGEAGMSKSYSVLSYLKDNKIDYVHIQSYSSPLEFYKLLYENKDKKIIIFDDIASLDDPKIISMIKESCWKILNDNRKVSYRTAEHFLKKLDIPESFELKANLILISNSYSKEFSPIINRGISINFNFTFNEKISIFKDVQEASELDDEVIAYAEKNCTLSTKNLSIRSLVILSRLKEKEFDWQMFAKEILGIDDDKDLLEKIIKKHDKKKDAIEEWCSETGFKERTFHTRVKELKGK